MSKTLIQCDFDDTVTSQDISLAILEAYAGPEWRRYWDDYLAGKITVGRFNELAFGMVKATRAELMDFIKDKMGLRPGFHEFVGFCGEKGHRLVIVSNGFDFYIEEVMKHIGRPDIEWHAAETEFDSAGLRVRYRSHEGKVVDRDFKLGYTRLFLDQGYRIAYVGDGTSDFGPAQRCERVFATGSLLEHCRTGNVPCTPFTDFMDVIKGLEAW